MLCREDLHIGIDKARRLLDKLGLPVDRLIVLEARLQESLLHDNEQTGRGRYLLGTRLPLSGAPGASSRRWPAT